MWGSEIFILAKKPVILSTIPLMVFFAASIGVTIAFLMPFQTVVAVLLMLLNTFVTVLFTMLNTVDTLLFIPSTAVEITDLTPFQTVDATDFTALNTVVTVDFMASKTEEIFSLIVVQMVIIVFLPASITEEITLETA